jgi:hypothetical protein
MGLHSPLPYSSFLRRAQAPRFRLRERRRNICDNVFRRLFGSGGQALQDVPHRGVGHARRRETSWALQDAQRAWQAYRCPGSRSALLSLSIYLPLSLCVCVCVLFLGGHGGSGKRSQTVWSASKDHTVVLWDICTGARLIVFDLERPPSCLQVRSRNSREASLRQKGRITNIQIAKGACDQCECG